MTVTRFFSLSLLPRFLPLPLPLKNVLQKPSVGRFRFFSVEDRGPDTTPVSGGPSSSEAGPGPVHVLPGRLGGCLSESLPLSRPSTRGPKPGRADVVVFCDSAAGVPGMVRGPALGLSSLGSKDPSARSEGPDDTPSSCVSKFPVLRQGRVGTSDLQVSVPRLSRREEGRGGRRPPRPVGDRHRRPDPRDEDTGHRRRGPDTEEAYSCGPCLVGEPVTPEKKKLVSVDVPGLRVYSGVCVEGPRSCTSVVKPLCQVETCPVRSLVRTTPREEGRWFLTVTDPSRWTRGAGGPSEKTDGGSGEVLLGEGRGIGQREGHYVPSQGHSRLRRP